MRTYVLLHSSVPNSVRLAERLRDALRKLDYAPISINQDASRDLLPTIIKSVSSADVVLADISSNGSNAPFELGFLLGLTSAQKKPIIPLVDQTRDIKLPSDLIGTIYLPYKGPEDPDLVSQLVALIKTYESAYG
jgi:predicted nucleotide-binding protein